MKQRNALKLFFVVIGCILAALAIAYLFAPTKTHFIEMFLIVLAILGLISGGLYFNWRLSFTQNTAKGASLFLPQDKERIRSLENDMLEMSALIANLAELSTSQQKRLETLENNALKLADLRNAPQQKEDLAKIIPAQEAPKQLYLRPVLHLENNKLAFYEALLDTNFIKNEAKSTVLNWKLSRSLHVLRHFVQSNPQSHLITTLPYKALENKLTIKSLHALLSLYRPLLSKLVLTLEIDFGATVSNQTLENLQMLSQLGLQFGVSFSAPLHENTTAAFSTLFSQNPAYFMRFSGALLENESAKANILPLLKHENTLYIVDDIDDRSDIQSLQSLGFTLGQGPILGQARAVKPDMLMAASLNQSLKSATPVALATQTAHEVKKAG